MATVFRVFGIEDGDVTFDANTPPFLVSTARYAYLAVRAGTDVDQSQLEEMVAEANSLLEGAATGLGKVRLRFANEDHCESERLTDLLTQVDHEKGVYLWSGEMAANPVVLPSQILAAYAFQSVDAAAHFHFIGDYEKGMEALATACQACTDSAFIWGHHDYGDMVRNDGTITSGQSKRITGAQAAKEYALSRWREGPPGGGKWKSKLQCANRISSDVVKVAKANKFKMSENNPERRVYLWLLEEKSMS